MRLVIRHRTEFAYADAAAHSVQYVRLTPRPDPVQQVLNWRLSAPGSLQEWRDGFGNVVHTVVAPGPHGVLAIEAAGEVETVETHGIVPLEPHGLPPQFYLHPTPLTTADETVRAFAAGFEAERARGTLQALHALMGGIHQKVTYAAGETHVHSTAAESLALGSGVCQDHAHLFLACCRLWGVPARYVSGYLHTVAEDGRHLGSHAWAEALVEHLGWVSFDPSNCQSATHAYVRLAVALDYQGAAPLRGVRRGGSEEEMRVQVQVQATGEQQ